MLQEDRDSNQYSGEKPWRDEETLRELYWSEGLTQEELGDELGCSRSTIQENMKKLGIPRRSKSETMSLRYGSLEGRFWEKVDIGDRSECWEWQASTKGNGYGQIRYEDRTAWAHRVAYELVNEPPEDDQVNHHCDNPICVNPKHLYLGGQTDNMQDALRRGRAATGANNGQAKLTPDDVIEIRQRYQNEDVTHRELGEEFGVARRHIGAIINREWWDHIDDE